MKISCDHLKLARRERKTGAAFRFPLSRAFTLIEIALCLAIIGFALLAIIIVLPYGMGTQRDNREETVIGQDATVLLEHIRSGSRGADYLTNYVYVIVVTNDFGFNVGYYNPVVGAQIGLTQVKNTYPTIPANNWLPTLTNGANIVGLLSTPQYTYPGNLNPVYDINDVNYITNSVRAYVRSISGVAATKPPQNNDVMVGDDFAYRVICVNAPVARDTNLVFQGYVEQFTRSQREIRLAFGWPVQPNGAIGGGRAVYRATVAGEVLRTNNFQGSPIYFFQPNQFAH